MPLQKAIARVHLDYCLQIGDHIVRKNIDTLERIQRRVTKMNR